MIRVLILTLFVLLDLALPPIAHASQKSISKNSNRSRVIDFEDEVVEGMNRRPLDSLSQISEQERRRRKLHLYRKRAGFKSETSETLRAIPYTP